MLPKSRRLSASEVRTILKAGRSESAGDLSMKFLRHEGPSKAAVVVSTKVAKTAVVRNTLRRAVYRALASHFPPAGVRVVFFVRKTSVDVDQEIKNLCFKHF